MVVNLVFHCRTHSQSAASGSMFQPLGATSPSPGPPGTSSGRMATANTRMGTAAASQRMGTASGSTGEAARPMTSNKGAGFSSGPPRGKFDPLKQGASPLSGGAGGPGARKEGGPSLEEQARDLERKVHELLEGSAELCAKGDAQAGETP